jgi:uncharacterized protein
MPPTNRTLVIMAKAPKPGSVKTRLAESLSFRAVTELYECLLNDTINLAQGLDGVERAIMCPAADVEALSRLVPAEIPVVPQSGDGLASGLTSVFDHFAGARHRRVIAFNSDSPHLPPSVLEKAFDVLDIRDIVIGPTDDGGYYLVGATASCPGLFTDDRMGTQTALQALLERAQSLGLSTGLVEAFYDVDELADLNRIAAELQDFPTRAPRTAAWLVEWRRALTERRSSIGAP